MKLTRNALGAPKGILRVLIAAALALALAPGLALIDGCGKKQVSQGDVVSVHYKGTLADGSVFDQSQPDRPLEFTAGVGQMIPGFDEAVLGMKLNEKKSVTIPAAEAYGERDESMIREVPRSSFPEDFEPVIDQTVTLSNAAGQRVPVKIVGISDENITVDFNHFLAGKDLTFEITVVGIK